MRTHVFKLAAPRAFVLSVSGAVLLAGCDPDEPAPVTPTPVATASPAPGSVATGNGNGSPQGATNAGLTSTPTPDRESRDAAPAATPAPTASVLLQTGNPADATAVPVSESDWAPRLGSGTGDVDSRRADGSTSVSAQQKASAASSEPGVPYTWQDGGRTRLAWLQNDLVLQQTSENTADDVIVREGHTESIVERQPRHDQQDTQPVFRSDSGSIVTLPGGVLLVLDGEWSQTRVDTFFAGQGIAANRVEQQGFVPNAFLIETAPGLPSLEVANALADEAGVLISSPNWRTEVELR